MKTDPQALALLGSARLARGDAAGAAEALQQVAQRQPDSAEVLNNLAVALARLGRHDEAVACLRRALAARPDWAELCLNLGNIHKDQGLLDEAISAHTDAVRLRPGDAEAHNLLGGALAIQGRLADARRHFEEALRLQPRYAVAHSNLLLALNYDPEIEPAELLAEHRLWGRLHGPGLTPLPDHANEPDPERRLRVGYVSPDFRRHAAARFIEPIFASHDPAQVAVYAYAEVPAPDAVTDRLRGRAAGWRSTCGQSDAQVADQVRADGIDLLVDLAGHSASNRLGVFAHQPAPVQVSYLGYPNTTGLATIGHRVTDAVCDPPGEPARHTEALVRLPGCFCCYAPPEDAPSEAPLPALARGHVTFGSLHHLAKLNGAVLDLWCAVLRAVPSARLLVFRNTLRGSPEQRLRREFLDRGIEASRVELRHEAGPGRDYLDVYADVDVLLDTLPWSGHATTCEALWMGVPVLTLLGGRHAGRMSASVLAAAGLAECVAKTPEDYVALASRWAGDMGRLAALRAGLREQVRRSPLCDGRAFTTELEAVYRQLWRRWCAGRTVRLSEPRT
jgi:predicted O-linked N-acetylglucosamine transferase (SPINDLY family)